MVSQEHKEQDNLPNLRFQMVFIVDQINGIVEMVEHASVSNYIGGSNDGTSNVQW